MGLDNIPHEYPCMTEGTAVRVKLVDEKTGLAIRDDNKKVIWNTDCDETIKQGGCPYHRDMKAQMGDDYGRVRGFMGTYCWYRGKYGNYLLEQTDIYNEATDVSFYGNESGGQYKTPSALMTLADAMKSELEARDGHIVLADNEEVTEEWKYAMWWAEWSAKNCLGSDCWY